MGLFNTTDIGIDLGTSSILVYAKGQGIVLREPSVVAVERSNGKLIAIGSEAKEIMGRAPANIAVIRPLKDGVISNYDITARMLKFFLKKVVKNGSLFKPKIVACVPSGVTEAEQRFLIEAAKEAGAKHCYLIQEPVAAAIGAGIDINLPKGHMVVDIGGGTSDIAVLSYGNVVLSNSIKCAGDAMNEALIRYLKKEYNLLIGENSAEQIKIDHCRAYLEENPSSIEISGRGIQSGLPENVSISQNEFVNAIRSPLNQIFESVRSLSERTPPELAADIRENGILLTGGGSMLNGLDLYLKEKTGLPCRLAEDPIACVAIGTGKVLEDIEKFGRSIFDYRRGQYFDTF